MCLIGGITAISELCSWACRDEWPSPTVEDKTVCNCFSWCTEGLVPGMCACKCQAFDRAKEL